MHSWKQLRFLDWPRFLRAFFFVDISGIVIPAWAFALRMSGTAQDSLGLENLRQLTLDADEELRGLLQDASERAVQDASGPDRR